mgnify:CR=1 FL=1
MADVTFKNIGELLKRLNESVHVLQNEEDKIRAAIGSLEYDNLSKKLNEYLKELNKQITKNNNLKYSDLKQLQDSDKYIN